jgi:hypothetical protein
MIGQAALKNAECSGGMLQEMPQLEYIIRMAADAVHRFETYFSGGFP